MYRCAIRGEPSHGHRQHAYKLVKSGRVVFELCERTDKQTNVPITILCTPPVGEVNMEVHISGMEIDNFSTVFTAEAKVIAQHRAK